MRRAAGWLVTPLLWLVTPLLWLLSGVGTVALAVAQASERRDPELPKTRRWTEAEMAECANLSIGEIDIPVRGRPVG